MDFVLLGKTFRYILAKRFEDGMLSEEQLRHNRIDKKIGGRFFFIYGVFVKKKMKGNISSFFISWTNSPNSHKNFAYRSNQNRLICSLNKTETKLCLFIR